MKKTKGGKNMDRKGISPLIGTVLLIGFTIGLAMLIFTWGGSFVETTTEETGERAINQLECSQEVNNKLEIVNAQFVGGVLTYSVNNDGTKSLTEIIARYTVSDVTGSTEVVVDTQVLSPVMSAFGSAPITGDLSGLTITPTAVDKIEVLSATTGDGIQCSDIKEETTTIA